MSKSNGAIKIESGIPLPARRVKWSALETMKAGDSFLVPDTSARCSAYMAAKRAGVKITTRAEGKAIRIWRL